MNDFTLSVYLCVGVAIALFYQFIRNRKIFVKKYTFHYTVPQDGWIDINVSQPPLEDEKDYPFFDIEILVTDGERVDGTILPRYNKEGKLVICGNPITHWMPFPQPPKKAQ